MRRLGVKPASKFFLAPVVSVSSTVSSGFPRWKGSLGVLTPFNVAPPTVVAAARTFSTTPARLNITLDEADKANIMKIEDIIGTPGLSAEEMTDRIMAHFSHLDEEAVLKYVNRDIQLFRVPPLSGYAFNIMSMSLKVNFLGAFKDHLSVSKNHPYVYNSSESKSGGSARFRLKKPFGANNLYNVAPPNLHKNSEKVIILFGESGIGKTHRALFSNPGGLVVYLLFEEDYKFKVPLKPKPDEEFGEIDDADLDAFRAKIRRAVARAFHGSVSPELTPLQVKEEMKKLHVRLVVDELGQKPNLIRLFIKQREVIQRYLVEGFTVSVDGKSHTWLCCKSADIVLVGTGISLNLKLGSDDTAYRMAQVESAPEDFFVKVVGELLPASYSKETVEEPLRDLLTKRDSQGNPVNDPALECIKAVIQNRRAAVLAAAKYADIFTKHCMEGGINELLRVFREAADAVVYYVALEYKGLNGLAEQAPDELRENALEAFKLSMPHRKRAPFAPEVLEQFVSRFGLLVEKDSTKNRVGAAATALGWGLPVRVAKKAGTGNKRVVECLTMSASVRIMLLAIVGFTEVTARPAAGAGLERLVALKCVLALMAAKSDEDLHHMLHTKRLTAITENKLEETPFLSSTDFESKETKVKFPTDKSGVVLLTLRHHLSRGNKSGDDYVPIPKDGSVTTTLKEIAGHVNNGRAVVVLNGARSPYADVIVVRRGYVGFFQAKDTGVFYRAEEEAQKLVEGESADITADLCRIAAGSDEDVPSIAPGLVIVCRRKSAKAKDLKKPTKASGGIASYVVPPAADFLYPFRWPKSLDDPNAGEFSASFYPAGNDGRGSS